MFCIFVKPTNKLPRHLKHQENSNIYLSAIFICGKVIFRAAEHGNNMTIYQNYLSLLVYKPQKPHWFGSFHIAYNLYNLHWWNRVEGIYLFSYIIEIQHEISRMFCRWNENNWLLILKNNRYKFHYTKLQKKYTTSHIISLHHDEINVAQIWLNYSPQ